MIPNPSLDCSYVVLNFWPNSSLVVLIKLFLEKKRVFYETFHGLYFMRHFTGCIKTG